MQDKIWEPNSSTKLSLAQMGFSSSQVSDAIRRYGEMKVNHSDKHFLSKFKFLMGREAREHAVLENISQLPIEWEPSDYNRKLLLDEGYDNSSISHYRDLFVLSVRETKSSITSPNSAFLAYCRNRRKNLPTYLPDNWIPSKELIEEIANTVCPDIEFITSRIDRFVSTYSAAYNYNWNDKFKEYIRRGWREGNC